MAKKLKQLVLSLHKKKYAKVHDRPKPYASTQENQWFNSSKAPFM